MENSVTYCRVSTKEQSDSLPVQQQKCDDFAASLKLQTVRRFVDSQTGRTDDRPQLQAMLKFCSANKKTVKHVIVSELSRLARNAADQGYIIMQLTQMGIQLRSHNEASFKGDAAGKLGKNVVGAFNQFFSDALSENTKSRMAAAVKEGRFVWVSPVGYVNSKNGRGSVIKPDPARAPLVRKGFG
jgi:site-specific DNA recombinase